MARETRLKLRNNSLLSVMTKGMEKLIKEGVRTIMHNLKPDSKLCLQEKAKLFLHFPPCLYATCVESCKAYTLNNYTHLVNQNSCND